MEVAISILPTRVGATRWHLTMGSGSVVGMFPRQRAQAMHMGTVHAHRCKRQWCIPKSSDCLHTSVLTGTAVQRCQWWARTPVNTPEVIGNIGVLKDGMRRNGGGDRGRDTLEMI